MWWVSEVRGGLSGALYDCKSQKLMAAYATPSHHKIRTRAGMFVTPRAESAGKLKPARGRISFPAIIFRVRVHTEHSVPGPRFCRLGAVKVLRFAVIVIEFARQTRRNKP